MLESKSASYVINDDSTHTKRFCCLPAPYQTKKIYVIGRPTSEHNIIALSLLLKKNRIFSTILYGILVQQVLDFSSSFLHSLLHIHVTHIAAYTVLHG